MNNIRKPLVSGTISAVIYGIVLLLCFWAAGWIQQHSSTSSDWPQTTNAAPHMTSKSFQEFLLSALPHVFYLSVIVVVLMHGYRLPGKWRKALPALLCILTLLLVGGLLFTILAERWKQNPRGLVKAVPLTSVFAGATAGLLRFLKDLKDTTTSREGIEIVGIYMGVFGSVGSSVAALFL